MIEIQNRHWQTLEHSPFVMPYAGQIVVHSFSGEELTDAEQTLAATHLSESDAALRSIVVDTDEFLPRFILTLSMEAAGDRDALQHLCGAAVEAWSAVGKDTEDLEFVEAHLAYEPELHERTTRDVMADIGNARYTIDELELPELDDFDIPVRMSAYEVFCTARDTAATT